MDKLYSNSFEDSVKSAFDKADNEFLATGNWDEIQLLLNKEMPISQKKRRYFFWITMAGLLIGGLLAYQFWKKEAEFEKANGKIENKPTQNSIEVQLQIVKPKIEKESKIKSAPLSIQWPETQAALRKRNTIALLNEDIATANADLPLKSETSNAKSQIIETVTEAAKEEKGIKEAKNSKVAEIENNVSEKEIELPVKPADPDSITSLETVMQPEYILDKKRGQSKWQWNLSFAPDFLLANIQSFYRPGVSLGFGINYQLSAKWTLRTGLLYNYTPVYESGQTYIFKPSPNLPAYNTLELKQVKGSLHIFEVPLSARFTASPNKKVSFMASVGMSSLFFVKQQLTYDLLLNGNTPLLWNSQNDSDDFGESHILSNLVIGTGVSFKTKRNTVIELEPVFKLPLEELGEGHNKLGTIAFYLHLKRPIFKQKK